MKSKKIMKNNNEKMTKFLQYLESSVNFMKKFICKVHRSIYIASNSLKKTIKQSSLATFGIKNWRKHQKNDQNDQISRIFWEKNYVKYITVYIKTILSVFHCFWFHKNITNTFEFIALSLKTNIIFSNFLINFCLI